MGVDPGGFKLNENLNRAVREQPRHSEPPPTSRDTQTAPVRPQTGGGILGLLSLWRGALRAAMLCLPPGRRVLVLLSHGGLLGASVGVAIASDLLAVRAPPRPWRPNARDRGVHTHVICAHGWPLLSHPPVFLSRARIYIRGWPLVPTHPTYLSLARTRLAARSFSRCTWSSSTASRPP
eukprot:2148447-Prymnesium_polylepis.1